MTDTINVPVATLMRWEGELDQIKGAGHISDEIVELFNSQAPAQPTQVYGWQLVPVWPTPKMIDATWYHEIDMSCGIESQGARNKRIYEAMLAVAPKPSDDLVKDSRIKELEKVLTSELQDAARYRWLRHMTTNERIYIVQQVYDKAMDSLLDESMAGGGE